MRTFRHFEQNGFNWKCTPYFYSGSYCNKCPSIRFIPVPALTAPIEKKIAKSVGTPFGSLTTKFVKCYCNFCGAEIAILDNEFFQSAYNLTIQEIEEKGGAEGNYDWLTDLVLNKEKKLKEFITPYWCPLRDYDVHLSVFFEVNDCSQCEFIGVRPSEKWIDSDEVNRYGNIRHINGESVLIDPYQLKSGNENYHDDDLEKLQYIPDKGSFLTTSAYCYLNDKKTGKKYNKRGRLIADLIHDYCIIAVSDLSAKEIENRKAEGTFSFLFVDDYYGIIDSGVIGFKRSPYFKPDPNFVWTCVLPKIKIPDWCPLLKKDS